jgi:hypothetical protein
MPEISRFYGVVIRMYFDDHNPPHFHVLYGSREAQIGIDPIELIAGNLPSRALSMVMEWAAIHQCELLENWSRLQNAQSPKRIHPLE